MKWAAAAIAVTVATAVAALSFGPRERAFGQVPLQVSKSVDGLLALSYTSGEKTQQITVIDPRSRAMSVYHIDATSGAIELKSVRRIEWDLEMMHFNTADPLPQEIRSLIEQNR
jgi:hypothetical protein